MKKILWKLLNFITFGKSQQKELWTDDIWLFHSSMKEI